MASQAQIESNRINAQRSTGPRTAEGKARASRNALKHGLLSEQALLETEDAEAHEEFCAAMREELQPRGPWEEVLAEQVITQGWRLRRAMWMETCLLDRALEPALEKDAQWRRGRWDAARQRAKQEGRAEADVPHPCPRSRPGEVDTRFAGEALMRMMYERNYLDVLRRYERAIERGMHEAMKALQAARAARASGAGEAEPSRCHGPTSEEDRAAAVTAAHAEGPVGEGRCETDPSGFAALLPDKPAECGGAAPWVDASCLPERGLSQTATQPTAPAPSQSGPCGQAVKAAARHTGDSLGRVGALPSPETVARNFALAGVSDTICQWPRYEVEPEGNCETKPNRNEASDDPGAGAGEKR